MNDHIFRKYDIRGVAERDLDDATVEKLGRAYGSHLVRRADEVGEGLRVGVGRDIRDSSNRLFDALETGLRRTGCHVVDLGVVPTPLVYFATHQLDLDGSVQITGSHNPAEYNGFKMMQGHAPLFGDDIQALKEAMIREDFVDAEPGGQWAHPELIDDYIEWVADDIDVGDYDVKVALDSGNGTAGVAAPKLVRAVFDTEPIELYSEPDGTFPNHHPDPTVEENLEDLRRVVREEDCDLGVAYDGDGDRIGVVDANGDIIWGDTLMILLARKVLAERPGATIIGEVKCSKTLFDDIEAHGGNAIMAAVGHSLIKDKIQETGAELAGEMSGHTCVNDRYFGFDDALYTTCRVMEIISQTGESVGELLDDVPETFATPELRRDCDEDLKFQIPGVVAEEFSERGHDVSTVDGARITFEHGWGLVRASNTQPKLVLRAEALSEEERDAYLEQLEDSVARAKRQIAQTSQG